MGMRDFFDDLEDQLLDEYSFVQAWVAFTVPPAEVRLRLEVLKGRLALERYLAEQAEQP